MNSPSSSDKSQADLELSELEQRIINHLNKGSQTLVDIATRFNIGRDRARGILIKLENLRKISVLRGLHPFRYDKPDNMG